ncbi:MAG TPA: DsbA family protein [Longimicrobiales bacterium]|nr:DsbA family protein [Longimicrobiales bacterium]
MPPSTPIFFFDYVDPLCYLLQLELAAALSDRGSPEVERVPVEVCPPPTPLLDPDGAWWTSRWRAAQALADATGHALVEPRILPWTRKAHEFVFHAGQLGVGSQAHGAVFEAMFGRGEDIGRVDVLVELARGLGLDANDTKVVLDVDRYSAAVAALSMRATEAGGREIPSLARDSETLQGFHNRYALRTFLLR